MINTIFHFVNDPTFDYGTAVTNGDISEYTIVFNSADRSIHAKGDMFGRMNRADMVTVLGDISDILPAATSSALGAIKIGYTSNTDESARKYGVKLDESNRAYVEVPWTDTITPVFDDTELKSLIATERNRIDNFISTLSSTIDAKNRELYADSDWVREIFGNAQNPGSVAAAYRKEIDDYLLLFDVWEYIDPDHPELGRKARIVELQSTADGLTHRMGEAETSISGNSVSISTLTHDLSGLTSTVTTISDDLTTVTRKESALEQTVDSIGLRVTSSEGDISTLQTKEASLQIQADKIQSRVVDTENSINGCYKVAIVQSPSNAASAVDVSTISAAVEAKGSLSNDQLINDEDFTTDPTENTLYKNSIPQYFTFSRYKGLTVRATEIEQTADSIALRVGTVEGTLNGDGTTTGLITRTSTLELTASSLDARVGSVEQLADTTDTALAALTLEVTGTNGVKESLSSLSSSVSTYENDNDTNLGNLIKMAASVLELKSSLDAQGYLSSTADVASAITNGSFTGYSGLSSKVSEIDGAYVSQASLTSQIQALDVSGQISTATSGLATESFVRSTASDEADAAETAAKGYADNIVAGALATMYASVDDVFAGIGATVTRDADGNYQSVTKISADDIYLNGNTWAQYIGVGTIVADTLTAGTATIKASLTVGGSGTPGTITMKDASDGTIGIWDKDKLAVGTTSSPSSSNSAMLVNADGSGSLSKGNISWNTNGDVSVNGTGQFNGDVYANQFRAGGTSSFNITVESDAINFNYGSTRQAWFSTKKLEMNSNGEIVDTGDDAPQGFYLYMISPRTGNLVTIDFESGMFVEVTNGTVTVHTDSNTVKEISAGSSGTAIVSNKTVYYTTDTSGSTPVNTYYWNSECTNLITGNLSDASHNYYIVVGDKYVVVNEDTGTGRSPYMLRRVTIYQPVKYDGNAHRLIPYGNRVYVIDKGTVSAPNRYFVTSLASTPATLYNTSVYMEGTTTTLDNMPSNMKLTSGSGSVQVYVATKSAGSSIPTLTNTISIFTPGSGGNSSVMTKVDYTTS